MCTCGFKRHNHSFNFDLSGSLLLTVIQPINWLYETSARSQCDVLFGELTYHDLCSRPVYLPIQVKWFNKQHTLQLLWILLLLPVRPSLLLHDGEGGKRRSSWNFEISTLDSLTHPVAHVYINSWRNSKENWIVDILPRRSLINRSHSTYTKVEGWNGAHS